MSTTIESLELEIKGSADGAERSLNQLADTLGKLKNATKGGIGLTAISKQLTALSNSATGINSNAAKNVEGIAKAISLLSGVKISSSIGNQLTSINKGFANLNLGDGASKIQQLVSVLEPLSSLPKTNLSSFVTPLKKLPEVLADLNKMDMGAFAAKMQDVANAVKPLADEMYKVTQGFSALPSKMQGLITNTDKLSRSNTRASGTFVDLYAKLKMAYTSVKRAASIIGSAISKINDYIENVNLFTVSMGKYADTASEYARRVSDVMGIDPGEWMRNQGIFMTLATGFGVVGDRAYIMSQQLTQLGYDISSFFNISYEDAMQKLQSGLSGELEPLRRLGYDLSQAKLEATALSLGINKAVSSMTQAEKAELRYYAIMTQVTNSHGDMARTLDAPANQLRVFTSQINQCARAIGSIFIPALNAILPTVIAVVEVVGEMAKIIASLFGFSMSDMEWSNGEVATSAIAENLEGANEAAKKLKQTTLGFDELNIISSGNEDDESNSSGLGFDFELPEYDFIGEATQSKISTIVGEMKEWLGITDDIDTWSELFDTRLGKILSVVGLIGIGMAAWKVSKTVLSAFDKIKKLSSKGITWSFSIIGAALFLSDLDTIRKYIEDFVENGASFYNVSGIISTFAGLIGDAMILLGKVQTGGALKVIEGVGQIVGAIVNMSQNGISWDSVMSCINGLTNVAIGIGLFTGHLEVTGIAMVVQGFTKVIDEIVTNWEAIKKGDWSGVDKVTLVIGAIEVLGGIAVAINAFSKIKGALDTKKAIDDVKEVTTAATEITTTTSTLTSKLTKLAKNLGLGVVIVAEVAAAAALFVGAIWVIGVELEKVAEAWKPVIDDGETVTIAVAAGTGILVGIGVGVGFLGSAGTTIVANVALGTLMLVEIGAAAALFLAEILAVGLLLGEVGEAWQPVIDDDGTIAAGIGIGTGILVGIGVVAAALGVAAVATAGLLPLAIGLGTGMLLEIGAAGALFLAEIIVVGELLDEVGVAWQPVLDNGDTISRGIEAGTDILIAIGVVTAALGVASVASVGLLPLAIALGTGLLLELAESFRDFCDSLVDVSKKLIELAPPLEELNATLPGLREDMDSFTSFMSAFADSVVKYSKSSVISGIAATIDTLIGFFTTDPVQKMNDEIREQLEDFKQLIPALKEINPMIDEATELVGVYQESMGSFESATGSGGGFLNSIVDGAKGVINGLISMFEGMANGVIKCINFLINGLNKISFDVPDWVPGIGGKKLGFNISTIKEVSIPRLAEGGVVTQGQMFIAREAGAELVGSVGRRTAVMNNDQIVESVSNGVAVANEEQNALLREQNSLLRALLEKETNTYIDGKKITKSVEKHQRERGRVLVTGGTY